MRHTHDLMLHVCCAPCATVVFEVLREEFNLTAFFYNPNIQPGTEYDKRLAAVRTLCSMKHIELIVPEYDDALWRLRTAGFDHEPEGGSRCTICFDMRLGAAAEAARVRGIARLATTLSVSPHKNSRVINAAGADAVLGTGITFIARDFKENDGYRRSCELSRMHGLYRQNYCGCMLSRVRKKSNGTKGKQEGV